MPASEQQRSREERHRRCEQLQRGLGGARLRRIARVPACEADVDGQARPLVWRFQKGKGRVCASVMGHYTWTLEDPLFRVLALRAVAWAAGERVERFETLK